MKHLIIFLSLSLLFSCKSNKNAENDSNLAVPFYVGTYTNGESEGIYKYILNSNGLMEQQALVAKTTNPSFLAFSAQKNVLIACNEISDQQQQGTVESYAVGQDSLTFLSRRKSGGAYPCFVAVNALNYVLLANYMGGNVGLLKLNKKGALSDLLDVQQHIGKGITARQEAPHAHSAWFVPNSNEIIAVDLGTNELWFSTLDTLSNTLRASKQQNLAMAQGAGPRHLVFHPNNKWIFVLNELNATVSRIQKNKANKYEIQQTISCIPNNFTGFNKSADIHISNDGKFLYASNRGHNSIVIYKVDSSSGDLYVLAFEPTKGNEPRNFSLSPKQDYLLVGNQKSNNIVSFKRNITTGLLTFVSKIEAPTPVCILFQ